MLRSILAIMGLIAGTCAWADSIPGHPQWTLDKLRPRAAAEPTEDGAYAEYGPQHYALRPNDSRPDITISAALARRITAGELTPEQVYQQQGGGGADAAAQKKDDGSGTGFVMSEQTHFTALGQDNSSPISTARGGGRSSASSLGGAYAAGSAAAAASRAMGSSGGGSGAGSARATGAGAGGAGAGGAPFAADSPLAAMAAAAMANAKGGGAPAGANGAAARAAAAMRAGGGAAASTGAQPQGPIQDYGTHVGDAFGQAGASLCGQMGSYGNCGNLMDSFKAVKQGNGNL